MTERPETSLDQKYQAPINEVSSIINDPSSMSSSIVGQNVSVGRQGDVLQHQSQQNSTNGITNYYLKLIKFILFIILFYVII